MIVNLWARCFLGAVVAVIAAYLVDTYVPLPPFAHIVAILLYVFALIGVLYGVYLLIFGPGRLPR